MCNVLEIAKSTFYHEAKEKPNEDELTEAIVEIFHNNRKVYGTRKIKAKLQERGLIVSRRRIGRIMQEQSLVSPRTPLRNLSLIKRSVMRRKQRMNSIVSLIRRK